MAGWKQSKRVSWAKELHQVRLFLAEDAPAISGAGTQDHLQAKGSWLLHAASTGNDDSSLPPGFEAPHPAYKLRSEISQIPLIKWTCPIQVLVNPEWLVAAGEESAEVAVQSQRQVSLLEAIYPRLTSVPPNPSVSSEVQDSVYNDFQTPVIPVTAIEDEDSSEQFETARSAAASPQVQQTNDHNLQGMIKKHDLPNLNSVTTQIQHRDVQTMHHGETTAGRIIQIAKPDVATAASAAFTAIMKSSEDGSMIDRDLLIRILSNPSLVEKLVSEHGAPKQARVPLASAAVSHPHPYVPVQAPALAPAVPPQLPHINTGTCSPFPVLRNTQMYPFPSSMPPQAANSHASHIQICVQAAAKDANYLKGLVHQHGGEKQDSPDLNFVHAANYQNNIAATNAVDPFGSTQQREAKPKIPRPCAYFNTPKGCRHGESCSYQHVPSLPRRTEQPRGSKRIKLDRGIAGRNY
ncbi:unnamed protein product [Musa acuminata subsp. malaccensis]|uniref:(wild Malaysian banana) hypothetical protein n=1 Tax=Musa acuminata subsp. malaccensis TaxID=214687 RepID=A0A804IAS2_MUSAM|nr:PREDICTED: zinc finger CCCH domain-containing protein 6-like [Musa acuminata subsp. malaccensis]CAG1849808.1 unnamed protein product [Musa acuminata subsp. malaccensis]